MGRLTHVLGRAVGLFFELRRIDNSPVNAQDTRMANLGDEWMTTAQAAAELRLDESQVRRLILKGVLPAFKPSPRVILIKRADVVAAHSRPKVGNPNFVSKPKKPRRKRS